MDLDKLYEDMDEGLLDAYIAGLRAQNEASEPDDEDDQDTGSSDDEEDEEGEGDDED
jgi:hypothetical protein